jgi:hypothetical protein
LLRLLGVAAITALMGIFSVSLLISVLAQKLILTRWEKCLHDFVSNIELRKQRQNQAANIIKFAVKVWCFKRKYKLKSIRCIKAQWKLFQSIRVVQEVKLQQRNLIDSCVVLPDLFNLQRNGNDKIEDIAQQMNTMKTTMDNIQNTLNVLLEKIQ